MCWSSQYLKMTATIPACVSVRFKILEIKIGPNSLTVARSRTPFCSDNDKISTGKDFGLKESPMAFWRSSIFGCPGLGFAKPLKSPLTSINKTGTPFSLKFSANTCKVFVFPVPVAPAIKPCLFMVFRGTLTKQFVRVLELSVAAPRVIDLPLKVYPLMMCLKKSFFEVITK